MGASCINYPEVNGEISELYRKLYEITKNRPLTNLIYASYLQTGVEAQMDAMGFTERTPQNEHLAKDVYDFFDVNTIERESTTSAIFDVALAEGAIDNTGTYIDFTDAEQALNIAKRINTNKKGVVSFVTKVGDNYNVIVSPKDAKTVNLVNEVDKKLQSWDIIKQTFNAAGIDITDPNINKSLFTALNGDTFITYLARLANVSNDLITQKEIEFIFQINEHTTQVQRLKSIFGDIPNAAAAAYTAYRTSGFVSSGVFSLINSAINYGKQFRNIDLQGLIQQINNIQTSIDTNDIASIKTTVNQLHQKYGININEIHLIYDEIASLKEAAEQASITLTRRLNKLLAEKGESTPETISLRRRRKALLQAISSSNYYSGVLDFLADAAEYLDDNGKGTSLRERLLSIPQYSDPLEQVGAQSSILMEVEQAKAGYLFILEALSNIDGLTIEENITDTEKQNIKNEATRLKSIFKNYEKLLKNLREKTMIDGCTEILGSQLSNGMSIVNLVTMAEADSSIYDYLYSMGRVSNPLIGTMYAIIRKAQQERNKKLNDVALRVRRATRKLKDAGIKNTRWMYEKNGYIISDIDWEAYNFAKEIYKKDLIRRGYRDVDLEEAMYNWKMNNTEERQVNNIDGRTERVPNASYRKPFPALKPAQLEYYREMMQLKGELGSILPDYAQRQYVPPQIRRSFNDAIVDSFRGGVHIKTLIKAIKTKFENMYTFREDDPEIAANGIIEGEDFNLAMGEMDNTPFRQIPIFYINLVEREELMKDFSGAMHHLAATALNYEAMNGVKDTIEFMGDYIKDQKLGATKGGLKRAESITEKGITIFKNLIGRASNSNTKGIIDGFIDKFLYGVKIKNPSRWTKFLKSIIAYNSVRSLSLNLKGIISNYVVGELQMMMEAGAGEFYNPIDYIWAHGKVFGDNTWGGVGRIVDFMMDNENSESVLLANLFDPLLDTYQEQGHKRYYRGPIRKLIGHDFTFMGYGVGEHMIHFVNMYSVLHHEKVYVNGKKRSLYSIFHVGNKQDGNSELIREDAMYKDEEGNLKPVDDAYIQSIKDKITYVNQTTHGSMNEEDKGLIHQWMLGRFVMNLRQWMVEHYSRRYRDDYWDATLKKNRRGFHRDFNKYMFNLTKGMLGFKRDAALRWSKMNATQKANVRRAISEYSIWASLFMLSLALGEPDDHKREFWMRMWIYQTKRGIIDVKGSTPLGISAEANTLINSPIAATNTINAYLYPVTGIDDLIFGKEIKSGKHAGELVYWRNIYKYWLPFTKQIEQMEEFGENNALFQTLDKNNL